MQWRLPSWWPRRQTVETPKKRIGLALSGGAARGVAHIGVLEVLEREGIRPAVVAGVSAGSIVGALYCAGYTIEQLKAQALDMHWSKLVRFCRPRLSLFDTTRLETYLNELVAGKTFDQLSIPFVALAVDILTSTEVALNEGPIAHAVRASCAIPGLFTPIEWGDYLLVDGGILNNMPVQVLRDLEVDYVIAVDVMSSKGPYPRPGNIFEMWMLSAHTVMRPAHRESAAADCIIYPEVSGLSFTDFDDAAELAARGRQAAESALDQLQADLG